MNQWFIDHTSMNHVRIMSDWMNLDESGWILMMNVIHRFYESLIDRRRNQCTGMYMNVHVDARIIANDARIMYRLHIPLVDRHRIDVESMWWWQAICHSRWKSMEIDRYFIEIDHHRWSLMNVHNMYMTCTWHVHQETGTLQGMYGSCTCMYNQCTIDVWHRWIIM